MSPAGLLYRAASWLLWAAAPFLLFWRARKGKEDPARLRERRGFASQPRPQTPLLWAHAVSLGEGMALLPLLRQLAGRYSLLLTTVTRSSAELLAPRLPEGVIHQYAPLDDPRSVRRFLAHWQPDLALFAESEWWPNLLWQIQTQKIPAILLNARLSPNSFRRWQRAPALARSLLSCFDLLLAQDEVAKQRLEALGGGKLQLAGNLKYDAPPLGFDEKELALWQKTCAHRRIWLAASTHEGEESIAATAHRQLRKSIPGLLTILVPRHPARGPVLARKLSREGLAIACRSETNSVPSQACDIFIADSFGELGLWMRLAEFVLVGGSLVQRGGQNPLEAARLGRAVLFGPSMYNFSELADLLLKAGAAQVIQHEQDLPATLEGLFSDKAKAQQMGEAGSKTAESLGGALEKTLAALTPFLPAPVAPASNKADD